MKCNYVSVWYLKKWTASVRSENTFCLGLLPEEPRASRFTSSGANIIFSETSSLLLKIRSVFFYFFLNSSIIQSILWLQPAASIAMISLVLDPHLVAVRKIKAFKLRVQDLDLSAKSCCLPSRALRGRSKHDDKNKTKLHSLFTLWILVEWGGGGGEVPLMHRVWPWRGIWPHLAKPVEPEPCCCIGWTENNGWQLLPEEVPAAVQELHTNKTDWMGTGDGAWDLLFFFSHI